MTAKLVCCCCALSLLTLRLPACGFSASVESMLSPPRLTVEQEQIYQALQTAAGSQISLKYPKSGELLSAFIVEDLDDDGSDEAIVFYEAGRTGEDENPLRICLLDQRTGGWRAVTEYPAAGAEIERVETAKLGSNPRTNLILRYSIVDGAEHAAEVFHYADGTLISSLSVPYSMMALRDLDGNGTMELLCASSAKAPAAASASVYELDENGSYVQAQITLPDTFLDVSRLFYGDLPGSRGIGTIPAIYMDGTTGATSVQTVVLTYSGSKLSLLYADSGDRFPNTVRAGGYQTMDIDGDGEAEIPVNTMFYGYSNAEAAETPQISMTNWYVCRGGLLMREHSSYESVQDGYVFVYPRRWERKVTAVQENEEIVFYAFDTGTTNDNGTPVLTEPLLRLAVVSDPIAADAMQAEGYQLLRRQGSVYYLGAISQSSRSLTLTESELLFAMKFL